MEIGTIIVLSIIGTLLYAIIGIGTAVLYKKANNNDKYDMVVLLIWPLALLCAGLTQNSK